MWMWLPSAGYFEWLILIICIALLLPRIFALAVNSILDLALRKQSLVVVSIGGISLRRITEIRLKIRTLPLPDNLGLSCKLHISIDEIAWHPSWRKFLHIRIRGAKVKLLFDDTSINQSKHASNTSDAASARPLLGNRSIPDIMNCLSINQSNNQSSGPSMITRFYCYMSRRFLVSLAHSLSVSLFSVLVIAIKGRSAVLVKIAGLSVDVDPSHSNASHNLNVRCGGIELRVEKDYENEKRFYNESTFTESFKDHSWNDGQQAFNALFLASTVTSAHLKVQPVLPMSAPPLLTIDPLTICAEMTVQSFEPTGITRVEVRGQGARIHIDPLRLISSVTVALVEYRRVIASLLHESRLRKAQQEIENNLHPLNPLPCTDRASHCSSGTSPILQSARQRDMILRFIPQAVTFALHRVTITLYQRRDDSTQSLSSQLSNDVFNDLINECNGPSPVNSASVDQLPFTPITERLDISMALLLMQASVKTRYLFNENNSLPDEIGSGNLISSFDASLAIARGPQINISQMHEPLLSAHSFKLDTSIMASSNTDHVPTRRSNSRSEMMFNEDELLAIKHGNTIPALFHPLGTLHPTNTQSVSAVLVTPHLNLTPSIGRWIDFLTSIGNRATALTVLIPGMLAEVSREPPTPIVAVTIPVPDNCTEVPSILVPSHSFDLTSFPKSIESWSKDIGGERLEVLVVHRASRSIFKHPSQSQLETQQQERQHSAGGPDFIANSDEPIHQRTYTVKHHIVVSLKVISNAQVSLYPSAQSQARAPPPSNPQQRHAPLFTLSIDEISLRFELEPYSNTKHSFKKAASSSQDSFAPLFSQRVVGFNRSVGPVHPKHNVSAHPPNCVISTAPRVRVEISLSSVVASLPFSYSVDPLVLAPHPGESIKQRGRLMTLQTASFIIDGGSPDVTLNADGFHLRYSHSLLQLIPEIAQFVLELIPLQILKFDPAFDSGLSRTTSSKPFIPAAPGSFEPLAPPLLPKPASSSAPPGAYPVPVVRLKGSITNLTVDFPYVLEFSDDTPLDSNGFPVTESDEQEIREITEKTLSEIRRFNERMTMKTKTEQQNKTADHEQSFASSSSPSAANAPTSATSSNSSDTTPPVERKTSLFTFMCTEAVLDVFLPTSQWSVTLTHSYCLHETIPFMTVETACLEGANPTPTTVKSMNVTASGIEGDWSPGMFLGLWKLIKDVTAAAINAKCGLFGEDGLALISLTGPVASMTSELDYQNNPTLSLLSTKKNHLDAFRLWYHHVRPRFLSEPYMHVNLNARKVSLRACLNRLETLQAFIVVDEFSSKMVPNDFTFNGITVDLLMHPLIHVDSIKLRRRGIDLTPIDARYSEEQNLLMEYLDLDLALSGVRVELAPQMDIGPLLETIILKVQAVVTSIWELPSLDFLSRRMGGPGYHGPPAAPAPGVAIVINNMEFSMIDEPMESFLQNLHQVWLNEKLEQERRLAIFKFKMADLASKNPTSPISINPIVEPLETDPVYESLHVFNSRRYMSRVQTLKGALPAGLNLKRARLLLASVGRMSMKMSLIGEHGSFYDEGVIVRLINQRRAEEESVFDTSADAPGLDRSSSFSNFPSHSPLSASQLIPNSPISSGTKPAMLTDPSCFSLLAAQYIDVSVENISVHLRNFPAPLFTCNQVLVGGSVAVAQTRPEFTGYQTSVMSPSFTSPQSAVLAQLLSPPVRGKGHSRTSSETSVNPPSGMKATVSVGGVHEVALELRYRPFQIFYDMSVSINDAKATFAPHYIYPLNDILKAINKITPPLPHLYPIQPIRLLAGQTRSAMKRADAPILPVNYLHLMRAIAHGKIALSVENTVVQLFATPSPYETSKYINVNVRSVSVVAQGALVRVGIKEVKLNHNTSKAKQQNLIEIPSIDIGVTVNWLCTNDCTEVHHELPAHSAHVPPLSLGRSNSDAVQFTRRHVSIGNEDDEHQHAVPHAHHAGRKRPAALKHIRGHSRHAFSPASIDVSEQSSMEHTCRMHVSLCISLTPPVASPPLSITLHSGSVLALATIATLYSRIPPYPMPDSSALRVYYEKYHRTRMIRYISALSSQMDLQHATLVLLEDNMNDLMIGMLARVEIDSAVLGGSDTSLMLNGNALTELTENDRKVVRQLSSQYPHLGQHYSEMIGAPSDRPAVSLSEDELPRAKSLIDAPTKSQQIRLAIGGLYLERFCLESLSVTVWEGANLGPARGICLAISSIDFCAEAVHERDMRSIPVDGLKHSKIFIDLTEKIPDSTDSESSEFDFDHNQSPLWRSSPSVSPSVSGSRSTSTHHVRSALPSPTPNIWSVSNTILRVRDVQCSIVHNELWQNLDRMDDQLSGGNNGTSRVVVYTYENQRYIPGKGWNKNNLFPTDRPGWSNVNGTEEVTKESIKLPSSEWEWETDWQLDFGLRKAGEVDEEGWEYSHDFPRKYSRVRTWHVSVRRRRWIRIRKLKNPSAGAGAHDSNKRQQKKVENAVNFLASVNLVSLHQKPYLHTQDPVSVLVDERRSQFRHWLCVLVKKSRQPTSTTAPGLPKTVSMEFESARRSNPTHVRSTSTVSVSSIPSDTSLLSYFHIRDAHDDPLPSRYSDEDDVLHSTKALLNSPVIPPNFQRPLSSSRNPRSVMDLSPSLSRFAARQSPEPTSSTDTLNLPTEDKRAMSPLLDLPTQHQIRILDPKMLLTVEIRATLVTLIDQYSSVLKELLSEDSKWLGEGRKLERQREADQRIRARQEMEALTSQETSTSASPLGGRRASAPRVSTLHTPGGHRGRFASAEDANMRPLIPSSRSLTPSSASFSLPSSRVPLGLPTHCDNATGLTGPSTGPVFNCQCRVTDRENASEAQEFFCLEIVNPQINIHSMETRGRLLFMTNRVTLYGRIDWLRSIHHVQTEHVTHTVPVGSFGFSPAPPSVVVVDDHQLYSERKHSYSPRSATRFAETSMPVISRDKFRFSIVLDEVQAFVAPTDIDVDAGVIWMTVANRGVLKSIMQPATLQINSVIRPELIPFKNVTLDDPLDFTAAPSVQSKASAADMSRNVFSFAAPSLYDDDEMPSPKPPTANVPSVPVIPEHALMVNSSSSNMIDIQLPELSFNLDAYQFSLLIDVLTTVTAVVPINQDDDDIDRSLVNSHSLAQLKKEAVLGSMLLHQMVWSMKTISTSLNSMQRQQEENEREVQPVTLNSPSSTNYASFQTWLVDTTNRIDRERELAANGNSDSASMFGVEDLHSRFHQLLSKHNELAARVFSLLQAIHYKQANLKETKLQYLNVSVMCERINFMMMKNEQAFTNLYVDELGVTFAAKPDSTLDTSVEIKSIGARNLLPHYQDSHRQENQWQELVQLLSPNRLTGNDALFSSAWNYKELMFHATLVLKIDAHHVTVSHCEINLHPISVKLTYESLSQIIDYFVHEQQQLHKKYASDRAKFLPLSQVVLDLNANQINQQTQNGSTSLPPSPSSKGIKQRMKGMAQKMRRPFTHSEHSSKAVVDDDEEAVSIDSDTEVSLASLKTLKPGSLSSVCMNNKPDGTGTSSNTASTSSADVNAAKADEETTVSFNYVRLGSSLIVVSYWSGGYTKYKIEDFQGLPIKVKPLLIQNKEWTMSRMGSHLKKEMIRMALGQMGEALGKFLAYKFGFAKGNSHSGALDEIALHAYNQSIDAIEDVSVVANSSGLVPQPIDIDQLTSSPPQTSPLTSNQPQAISPVVTTASVKTMSSPSTPSTLHNMAASSRKIGQNVKLLFGDLSKASKKRKDSDVIAPVAAPPALFTATSPSAIEFDPLVLLHSPPNSTVPPLPHHPPRSYHGSSDSITFDLSSTPVGSPPPVPARPRAGSNSSLQMPRDAVPRRARTPVPVFAEDLQEYEEEEIHL